MARAAGPTKDELQQQVNEYEELHDQVAGKVDELLDPVFTREQIVEGLQEIDQLLTAGEEEEEEDEEDEDDGDEEDESFL